MNGRRGEDLLRFVRLLIWAITAWALARWALHLAP